MIDMNSRLGKMLIFNFLKLIVEKKQTAAAAKSTRGRSAVGMLLIFPFFLFLILLHVLVNNN